LRLWENKNENKKIGNGLERKMKVVIRRKKTGVSKVKKKKSKFLLVTGRGGL
jgi:hypothetical protein